MIGVWSPGRRVLTAGLILIVTLAASEALAIATVMPLVERDLGDLALYGWVFSAFFLGNLVGVVVAGRSADRVAPVIPFVAGLVLFIAGLLAGGLAGSMPMLVAARVVQGLGAGALPAVAYVCIGRVYPAVARPRMFALLSTAWVLPSAIGPGLSGIVGERFSWRVVFLGLIPFVVACGLLAAVAVRKVPTPKDPPPGTPLFHALLLAVGAGLLLRGLDTDTVAIAIALVLAGGTICFVSYRALTPADTLRAKPGVPATILTKGLFTFAFFGADAFVPLGLTAGRGTSIAFAGAVITTVSIAWTIGAWIQAHRVGRSGPRPVVTAGLLSLAVGVGIMAAVMFPAVPVVFAFVAWAAAGVGAGLTDGPLSAAMLSAAAPGTEGRTTAAFQLTEVLGIALGTGVAGAIVAFGEGRRWSPASSVTIVFAMSIAVALAGVAVSRRIPATVLDPHPGGGC